MTRRSFFLIGYVNLMLEQVSEFFVVFHPKFDFKIEIVVQEITSENEQDENEDKSAYISVSILLEFLQLPVLVLMIYSNY